jgi:hypothetical protein
MSLNDARTVLEAVEADNRDVLYTARRDKVAASNVVPKLVALLDSEDRDTLLRALRAFVTIGPLACDGAPKIARLLRSSEIWVFQAAAIALAYVSLKKPGPAVQPLVEVANMPGREKYAMLALIQLGEAARSAAPVFARSFEDRSARIRRLALRGLVEIGADDEMLSTILRQAARDKSKEVREYASKLSRRLAHRTRRCT